jgi:thiol-disulfide isomerase/thioredoxin
LHARWIGAGHDAAAQQPIAEELVKLDGAHPESNALTALTYTFSNTAASAELKASLLGVVTTQMTTPMAQRIAASIKQKAEADAKLAALVNKPLVLAGTTVDGQPFSIGQYKGKVVLVDFWATWCGPCKAELPHVKDVYAKYHDKGLEIVGVSNDFKADELRKFTPENGMPWVELFDAQAAADHQWNPLTENFGILGIPTMFLVDKKGIMRTYEAREDMDTLIPKLLSE